MRHIPTSAFYGFAALCLIAVTLGMVFLPPKTPSQNAADTMSAPTTSWTTPAPIPVTQASTAPTSVPRAAPAPPVTTNPEPRLVAVLPATSPPSSTTPVPSPTPTTTAEPAPTTTGTGSGMPQGWPGRR